MTTRFELRKDDHPEGNRFSVVDRETGRPVNLRGVPQVWLPEDDAEELLEELNAPSGALVGAA